MSSQAGVWYFDAREVLEGEAGAVLRGVGCTGCNVPIGYRAEGIFLAHAALQLDPKGPDACQPYHAGANIITFDGRVDNREDLLLRLRDVLRSNTGDQALRGDADITNDAALVLAAYT